MLAADVVGLVGAGGALKELKATNAVLRRSGFSLARAHRGETISRPMHRTLTSAPACRAGDGWKASSSTASCARN